MKKTGTAAGSRIVKIHRFGSTAPQRRVPVTALIAWPNFHPTMEGKVENQVAALAETRTPNLHRANKSLIESADGRVATACVLGAKEPRGKRGKTKHREQPRPFLPGGMVTDRSSPSRVRCRRKERALDGSGPL